MTVESPPPEFWGSNNTFLHSGRGRPLVGVRGQNLSARSWRESSSAVRNIPSHGHGCWATGKVKFTAYVPVPESWNTTCDSHCWWTRLGSYACPPNLIHCKPSCVFSYESQSLWPTHFFPPGVGHSDASPFCNHCQTIFIIKKTLPTGFTRCTTKRAVPAGI